MNRSFQQQFHISTTISHQLSTPNFTFTCITCTYKITATHTWIHTYTHARKLVHHMYTMFIGEVVQNPEETIPHNYITLNSQTSKNCQKHIPPLRGQSHIKF